MTEFPTSMDHGDSSRRILEILNKKYREMAEEDGIIEDEDRVPSDGGVVNPPCYTIQRILEDKNDEGLQIKDFLLPDNVLGKRSVVLDIVTPLSKRSCCFTKAYGHYSDGTGSVLTKWKLGEVHNHRVNNRNLTLDSDEQILDMKRLQLRYFTPREVARLMCFPEQFTFPEKTTLKQKYRLLGNSVNVHVISLLIALMTSCE